MLLLPLNTLLSLSYSILLSCLVLSHLSGSPLLAAVPEQDDRDQVRRRRDEERELEAASDARHCVDAMRRDAAGVGARRRAGD